jgi:predicted permease
VSGVTSVFVEVMLPVVALAGAGVVLERRLGLDVDTLNDVLLYLLLPALVFHSLVTSEIGGGPTLRVVAAVWAFTFLMLGIAAVVGRAIGTTGESFAALLLASAIPNVGNYGIPVSTFAFGETGRTVAVLFVAAQNVVTLTVGVFIAARGAGAVATHAARRVLELPLIYAILLAILVRATVELPGGVLRTVGVTGNASIPLFLLVLGATLARTDPGSDLRTVTPAVLLKLVVAPVLGVLLVVGLGIDQGAIGRTFVLEAAGPVAIVPLSLAIEFTEDGSGPAYLSAAILATTLLALPIGTALIVLLQSGAVGVT